MSAPLPGRGSDGVAPVRPGLFARSLAFCRPGGAVALALLLAGPVLAQDNGAFGNVRRIELDAFLPEAGRITFSELPLGTRNPVFYPSSYGAGPDGVYVGFAGYFEGQGPGTPATCPAGAPLSGCVGGSPVAPLRLAAGSPNTMIVEDSSNPNSPALSGSPKFNGTVSFVFDKDLAGVGLAGGYFDAVETTAITAFDRSGRVIGGVRNLTEGMDYLALVTADGSNTIAGIQFSLVGAEPAGFAIDDLSFAFSSQLDPEKIEAAEPPTPELFDPAPEGPRQFMHKSSAEEGE